MTATSNGTPSASGDLAETPFCHVLLYLYRRPDSAGTLVIEIGSEQALVRIQRGRPTRGKLPWDATRLFDGLLPLCGLEMGTFRFYDDDRLATDATALAGTIDPYALLAASLDRHPREDAMAQVLARFEGTPMRLPPNRDVGRLRLEAKDAALLELIRAAPATPEALIEQSPLPNARTRAVLYALIATHMLVPHEQRTEQTQRSHTTSTLSRDVAPASNRPNKRSSPAWRVFGSLRPDLSMLLDRNVTRPLTPPPSEFTSGSSPPLTDTGSGVAPLRPSRPGGNVPTNPTLRPPRANSRPIVASTPSAAPSRPSSASIAATRAPSGPIVIRTTAPPRPPSGPIAAVQSGPPPSSSAPPGSTSGLPASLPPEDIPGRIRRVEALMQRLRHDEALAEVDAMLELEPKRAELYGLRAHVLFEKHAGGDGLPRAVVDALKRALELDPDETRALFTRGLVCKRAGDLRRAITYFERVLSVDREHIGAQREMRLAKLRV